jgi:hypothetical protein
MGLTFDAVNQRNPNCAKCGNSGPFIYIPNIEDRRKVSSLFEKQRTIEAICLEATSARQKPRTNISPDSTGPATDAARRSKKG